MLFKISNSFFYTQKVAYFVFKDSSSPVKASSFNPLSPDLLTLYRWPIPIKIWPTYAVPPSTTLYPRSTYDLWRAGSSPTIFQPVEKLIPLTTTSQSGPDQSPLYFRPTYALPDQGPLIADLSIFPERERAGVDRVSGVNGPLNKGTEKTQCNSLYTSRVGQIQVHTRDFYLESTFDTEIWETNPTFGGFLAIRNSVKYMYEYTGCNTKF